MPRTGVWLLLAGTLLPGAVRDSASDYPAWRQMEGLSLGAEYLVRSVSTDGLTFLTPDYLVVEVALFPDKGKTLEVSHGHFSLRLNNSGRRLMAQSPPFVAASVKYPDWERRRVWTAGAGVGDAGIGIGPPASRERFPGDPRPSQRRLPAPPRAPGLEDRSGIERPAPRSAADVIVEQALPEGNQSGPVRGFLYFPYPGKTKSLRLVELIYESREAQAVLQLLP